MQPESISMYYKAGTSDKEYRVQLVEVAGGWVVNFQYGRRESTLRTDTKTKSGPTDFATAKRIYDRIVAEKKGEGYTEGAAQAAPVASDRGAQFVVPEELQEVTDQRELRRLIAHPGYWLQEKRDGHRCLVVKHDGKLTRFTRKGNVAEIPAGIYCELAALPFESFILDGEIEGDRFIVFDALQLDNDCRQSPYEMRFFVLQQIWPPEKEKGYVYLVDTWHTEEAKAAASLSLYTARAEGLVFKDITAPYAPGRAHHYKFKFVKTLSAKVLGQPDKNKESVAVGVLKDGKWLDIGTVSTLYKEMPAVGTVIEVRYLYATAGNKLYQPVFLRVRDDVTDAECTFEQLRFKQGVENGAAA